MCVRFEGGGGGGGGWNIRMVTFGWFIWLLSVGLCWYPFDICVLWLLDVLGNCTRPWEPNGELLDSGRSQFTRLMVHGFFWLAYSRLSSRRITCRTLGR